MARYHWVFTALLGRLYLLFTQAKAAQHWPLQVLASLEAPIQLRRTWSIPYRAPPHLCCCESPTIKSSCSPLSKPLYQNRNITNAMHLHLIDDTLSEIFTLYFLFKLLLSNFRHQPHSQLVKKISNISKQMFVSFLTRGQCRGVPEILNSWHWRNIWFCLFCKSQTYLLISSLSRSGPLPPFSFLIPSLTIFGIFFWVETIYVNCSSKIHQSSFSVISTSGKIASNQDKLYYNIDY